jgi:hypothetical protein
VLLLELKIRTKFGTKGLFQDICGLFCVKHFPLDFAALRSNIRVPIELLNQKEKSLGNRMSANPNSSFSTLKKKEKARILQFQIGMKTQIA